MRPVEEVRRLRLQELKEAFGTYAALNDALGLSTRDSTLSQIGNASTGSKSNAPKTMGSVLARRIEATLGKPNGWMDTDPSALLWPFERLSTEEWHELGRLQVAVEDVAVAKARELLAELRSRQKRGGAQ